MRDSEAMARAAEIAAGGRFRVEPNPLVGCVIVKRGRIIAEGFHGRWGGPHAEAAALRKAGGKARGATVFVTLAPCDRKGKTPACTKALIRAGVKQVVYAHDDPDSDGPRALREAGIRVRKVRATKTIRAQVAPHLRQRERKRPWVIAKWAMTLDGRIAARGGDSKWVTGERARKWAHRNLRATIDAILVGSGTAMTDNPSLTNRSGRGKQPLRVIICGRRLLWPNLKTLKDGGPTLLAIPEQFRPPAGADTLVCGRAWRVDMRKLLGALHGRGIRRLLVEGGGELLGSMFDADLVDQVAAFVAPRVVGGISAVQAVGGKGKSMMSEALDVAGAQWTDLGPDRVIEGYVSSATRPR